MSASCIIIASLPSFCQNYQNWWKFDDVLAKQFCIVFLRHSVHSDVKFCWELKLKRHLLKSHNEGLSFKCETCQKNFIRSSELDVKPYSTQLYVDMKVWSRMFAVNVQSVSVQQLNWNLIYCHTQNSDNFTAVDEICVSNINVKLKLKDTLRNVLISWD